MNTEMADRARRERLSARAAKYHAQVERLRALAAGDLIVSAAPVAQPPAPVILDRPATACAAPGCFRPTTDGICDRCRATAAAEAVQAANVELVERLHANEAERARNRPPADPAPPRYFTSADYDPERVHAAQAARASDAHQPSTEQGADHG